jgi:hypothetical protein
MAGEMHYVSANDNARCQKPPPAGDRHPSGRRLAFADPGLAPLSFSNISWAHLRALGAKLAPWRTMTRTGTPMGTACTITHMAKTIPTIMGMTMVMTMATITVILTPPGPRTIMASGPATMFF